MFIVVSPMVFLKGRNYSFHLLLLECFSENAEFPNIEILQSTELQRLLFLLSCYIITQCLTDFLHLNEVLSANY